MMSIYRLVWRGLCGLLGALGVVVALAWSVWASSALFVCVAVTAGGIAAIQKKNASLGTPDTASLRRLRRQDVTRSALLSGVVTTASIGLLILFGFLQGLLVLATIAGGSPYAIGYCLRRFAPASRPARNGRLDDEHWPKPEPGYPSGTDPDLAADAATSPRRTAPRSLSDDALCLAWRTSFSVLQRTNSPSQQLRIVEERQAYLDELERRDARAMAAWLASGPRAAGDPSRFVRGEAPSHARIDWDRPIPGPEK